MAYCSVTNVRRNINLETFKPSDVIVEEFIAKADAEIDTKLGHVRRFIDDLEYQGRDKILTLSHDFEKIEEITINGQMVQELHPDNLLTDGDIEDIDSSDDLPDDWTGSANGDDDLTAATDYAFIRDRSLKINKDASGESYWYSDAETIGEKEILVLKVRVKVDADTDGSTYIKLIFDDADGTAEATHTSAAVSLEITQPGSAGTITLVSDSTSDITQVVTVDGLVNSVRTTERMEVNGTTTVTSSNSFSYIYGCRISSAPAGTVTVTRSTDACTLTASAMEKSDWVEAEIEGESTDDTQTVEARLFCDASTGDCWGDHFQLFRRNWKPLAAQRQIMFLRGLKINDLVKVIYLRAEKSKLIKELSRDLASMYVIMHLVGGETAGANYEKLKERSFGLGHPWAMIYDACLKRYEKNLEAVLSHDAQSTGIVMGNTYIAGED